MSGYYRTLARSYAPPAQYLLNFSKASGPDTIGDRSTTYYTFSGEFYIEVDFEYSALDSSFAPIIGKINTSGGGSLRILVNATTTIVNVVSNVNMSFSKSTTTNTRYTVKIRRDSSNVVWISYDGGAETSIGTRVGDVFFKTISNGDTRYLTGKIYRFNINGEEFACNEGSGATVTGSLGTVLPIVTDNVGGITYINNTMWELQ